MDLEELLHPDKESDAQRRDKIDVAVSNYHDWGG